MDKRVLYKIWILAILYETIMPTKPILVFMGEKGSGKTSALKVAGTLFFGKEFDVTPLGEKQDDFDSLLTHERLIIIDNADSKSSWLEDRLATISTGGTVRKRKLYTDSDIVELKPHCFIGITTRTPYFRRDDVADRVILMDLGRLNFFKPEHEIISEILENRNSILTELLALAQLVIKNMTTGPQTGYVGDLRMADFASFATIVGGATGDLERVQSILKKIGNSQAQFATEMDPLIDLISIWINENPNKFVTYEYLFKDLKSIAREHEIDFYYKSHRSFSQKMRNLRSTLDKIFIIKESKQRSNIMVRSYGLKSNLEDEFI